MPEFKSPLSEKDVLQSQVLSHSIWSGGKTVEDRHTKLQEMLSESNGELLSMCGIVDDDRTLMTSLKTYYTELKIDSTLLPAVGLGAIFTNEKYRKKGWAKNLIQMVLQEVKSEGYSVAYLFSDIGEKYYEQFGFIPLPALDFSAGVNHLPETSDTLEVRPATEADMKTLATLFDSTWKGSTLHVNRTPKHWSFFGKLNLKEAPLVFIQQNEPVGYVCLNPRPEKLWVEDFCVVPTFRLQALSFIRKEMEKLGLSHLEGWHHPFHLSELKKEIRERNQAVPMILFFKDKPKGWTPLATYFSSVDHF